MREKDSERREKESRGREVYKPNTSFQLVSQLFS